MTDSSTSFGESSPDTAILETGQAPRPVSLPVLPAAPKLPHMRCESGCGECCGPVICTKAEFDALVAWAAANGIRPARQGLACPFFQGGACAVYPARPFVCRLFGHSPALTCPRGHNVNVPQKRERKLMEEQMRQYVDGGREERWLHSLVYTDAEMVVALMDREEGGTGAT